MYFRTVTKFPTMNMQAGGRVVGASSGANSGRARRRMVAPQERLPPASNLLPFKDPTQHSSKDNLLATYHFSNHEALTNDFFRKLIRHRGK